MGTLPVALESIPQPVPDTALVQLGSYFPRGIARESRELDEESKNQFRGIG